MKEWAADDAPAADEYNSLGWLAVAVIQDKRVNKMYFCFLMSPTSVNKLDVLLDVHKCILKTEDEKREETLEVVHRPHLRKQKMKHKKESEKQHKLGGGNCTNTAVSTL